jgi:lysozyme family protein
MTDYTWLIKDNEKRWEECHILPAREHEVTVVVEALIETEAQFRYLAVAAATGVPWPIVAVIAYRESGADFTKQLGQGDPLNEVSRHVPRGRGPYWDHTGDGPGHDAWHRCAVDTLQNTPPYTARWRDWTIGGALTITILYNGIGYEKYHNEPSPYDWGATNIEKIGKYTSDGHFDPAHWDTQIGVAALLKKMMELDPSIKFVEAA